MPPPPRATVLVGDDEPLLRKLIVRILAPQGFEVLTAADGDEAVRAADERPDVDVVLLDAKMPPAGAGEALRAIRRRHPGVGVVLTSGASLSPELERELVEGDGIFLRKPFAPAALVKALEHVLGPRKVG